MMASNQEPRPPFVLSRASLDDIPEIIQLQYQCFPPDIRKLFMACKSEADLPRYRQEQVRIMETDPHGIWIKVTDPLTGRIVAASDWKIYLNRNGASSLSEHDSRILEWLEEGEVQDKTRVMMRDMDEARHRANPDGFIYLHICFTHSRYRRRGAGAMMMQWGCDVADQLFLPAWIEASPEGNYLYRRYGFYDYEPAKGGLAGMNMRRDARMKVDGTGYVAINPDD